MDMFDFGQINSPGVLSSQSYYAGRDTDQIPSRVDGAAVNSRLVVTIRDVRHEEPADVCVYPFFLKPGDYAKCGIEFRESLDRTQMLCPAILCDAPINEWTTVGAVDGETARKLTNLWQDGFLNMNDVVWPSGADGLVLSNKASEVPR
jgi:hypothetical protein